VVARSRRVEWAEAAHQALDEVLVYAVQQSPDGAARILIRALDTAASLATLAERGRVVREVGDSTLRELPVYDYRLMYRVHEDRVVIRAFLHGARDFSKWRREQSPEF